MSKDAYIIAKICVELILINKKNNNEDFSELLILNNKDQWGKIHEDQEFFFENKESNSQNFYQHRNRYFVKGSFQK